MPLLPKDLGQFVDLRSVGWGVPRPEASLLAHARGLLHWRQRHKFCSLSGNPNDVTSAGHVMTWTVCNTQNFLSTDPAVIMLVRAAQNGGLRRGGRVTLLGLYQVERAYWGFQRP